MSGKKRLLKAIKNNRVIAYPSKKVKKVATDQYGNVVLDNNGRAIEEEVQLYKIRKMY